MLDMQTCHNQQTSTVCYKLISTCEIETLKIEISMFEYRLFIIVTYNVLYYFQNLPIHCSLSTDLVFKYMTTTNF